MLDREKFASQADAAVLAAMREIAEKEGRKFQAILDEAMRDYIEKKKNGTPRRQVMDAFAESMADFDDLYKKLAK